MKNKKDKKYSTLETLKKVDEHIWMLEYKNGYSLDKMLKEGKKSMLGVASLLHKEVSKAVSLNNFHDGFACSTFNATTPEGKYILGRNFDYKEAPCIVLWTKPENGYSSIAVADSTFMLYGYKRNNIENIKKPLRLLASPYTCMDGINEKGLACAVLEIKAKATKQKTGKTPITTTVALRAILDKCKNVEEAIEFFASYDMYDLLGVNYHYQIADAEGKSAVIEYVNDTMHVIKQEKEGDCLKSTNFFITPEGDNTKGRGKNRYQRIDEKLCKANGILTEKEAMTLLSNCTMKYHHKWMPHMVITLWSNVYNCSDKTMLLCAGMDYNTMYKFSVDNPNQFEKIENTKIKLEILNEENGGK